MADSIRTISYAIIQAGHIFNSAPDVWKGGPTKRWAGGFLSGTGHAISGGTYPVVVGGGGAGSAGTIS